MHIGRRCHHRVYQLAATVNTNVRLHVKISLVSLVGLVHLCIPDLVFILGLTRRTDDGCIHDCASGKFHTVPLKIHVDQPKKLITQIVMLHQMPELADGCLVRHWFISQINTEDKRMALES